jgi:hypothetical protein
MSQKSDYFSRFENRAYVRTYSIIIKTVSVPKAGNYVFRFLFFEN